MTRSLRTLLRERRGAAAVEFAIGVPVLLLFIFAIAQFGIFFFANAGVHHAVGEGARYALIYPTPSDAAIRARMLDRRFGLKLDQIQGPTVVRGVDNGVDYAEVSMRYTVPINFVFFRTAPVTIDRSQRAYLVKN